MKQSFLEFHKQVSADFVIGKDGRKVHKKANQVADANDKNGNGIPDDKEKKLHMESTDICKVCGQTPCNCTSIEEAVDKGEQRFLMLARLGLVDKSEVSKVRLAFDALHSDKPLTVAQRTLMLKVFEDLIGLVTGDDTIFNRVKLDVQKESKDTDKDDVPFDGPYKKSPENVKDKSGAVHSVQSRVRHLARLAIKKQQQKSK